MQKHLKRCITALALVFSSFSIAENIVDPEDQKSLRELEEQVTQVKERVHKTKSRLQELEEAVLRGKITGSKALITFENNAEGFLVLESAEFYIDEKLVKKVKIDRGAEPVKTLDIFDSDLPAGEHKLRILLQYRGSGKSMYKTFQYLKDHIAKISSTEDFPVEYGKTTQIKITAFDKGYFKEHFRERLGLDVKILKDWGTEPAE